MHWSLSVTLRRPKAIDTQSKLLSAKGICSPLNCTNSTPITPLLIKFLRPSFNIAALISEILEFSKTDIVPLEKFYDFYSFNVMPKLGKFIANDEESYQYLAESIRKHPDQETLKKMVLDAGFGLCEYHNLSGGIVALHKGIKTQ
jgi:hypothetical protein